jgi:hypothetical protein
MFVLSMLKRVGNGNMSNQVNVQASSIHVAEAACMNKNKNKQTTTPHEKKEGI